MPLHKTAGSTEPTLHTLSMFDPSWFADTHALVATLWRTGVTAVAEIGCAKDFAHEDREDRADCAAREAAGAAPGPQPEHVAQFGVPWVSLGAAGPAALRRLAVGCQRFTVAVATDDVACIERSLGAHPVFRKVALTPLRP